MSRKAPCKDCLRMCCDCALQIWSYRFRDAAASGGEAVDEWAFSPGITRARAAEILKRSNLDDPETRRGPVQRMSDPPFNFDALVSETAMTRDFLLCAGGATCTPECGCLTRNFPKVNEPRINVTQAELARLLFDGSTTLRKRAWKHAEIDGEFDSHPLGDVEQFRLQKVLDVMWNGTELERREMAESRAAGAFRAARTRK